MAQVIKNMGQFAKALEPKIVSTLELVAEDVKHEIDNTLGEYYNEYSSIYYQRTAVKLGNRKLAMGK